MNMFKNISVLASALIITSSLATAYAETGEITQTRANERVRTEFNIQTPDSDSAQARNREELMVMNKNQNQNQYQNQYQYQHQYRYKVQENNAGSGDAMMAKTPWQSNAAANPAMQRGAFAGSMNPQSTAGRSMGGARR